MKSLLTDIGDCCIKYIRRRVKTSLTGILDNSDDETNTDCLHGNVIRHSKRLQAIGIRSKDPPATPEAPAALKAASTQRMIDVRKSTWIPSVCAVDNAITEIVIAAPAMLIVAPRGMEIEYVSSSSPSFYRVPCSQECWQQNFW